MANIGIRVVGLTEFKKSGNSGDICKRVQYGAEDAVIITRNEKPSVVMISLESFQIYLDARKEIADRARAQSAGQVQDWDVSVDGGLAATGSTPDPDRPLPDHGQPINFEGIPKVDDGIR